MKAFNSTIRVACGIFVMLFILTAGQVSAADIQVYGIDPAGVGVNDPTPAAPVGGNAERCGAAKPAYRRR